MTEDLLARLFAHAPAQALGDGDTLFRRGDPAGYVFLIEAGRLRMVRHAPGGEPVPVHTGRAGELFAEGALFADAYGCDAVCEGATVVRALGKAGLLTVASADPALLLGLLGRVARQLHHARTLLELRRVRPASARLLAWMRLHADPDSEVHLDRPFAQVAAELGLTPEAGYRSLAVLATCGLARRDGSVLHLLR